MRDAVIVEAVRTPVGKGRPGGALHEEHPVDLLARTLVELVERAGIDPVPVDDVIGGCVTQAGDQAANITRTAVLAAGFPQSVPGMTVDRQCGSSQQAAHIAAQGVMSAAYDVAIGHPLGGSGARIMTTLLHALEDEDARFGLQTMCEAGGMANATVLERL